MPVCAAQPLGARPQLDGLDVSQVVLLSALEFPLDVPVAACREGQTRVARLSTRLAREKGLARCPTVTVKALEGNTEGCRISPSSHRLYLIRHAVAGPPAYK